MQDQPVYHIR